LNPCHVWLLRTILRPRPSQLHKGRCFRLKCVCWNYSL
jgi:hypothetical protein